jgi:hypothetical protein
MADHLRNGNCLSGRLQAGKRAPDGSSRAYPTGQSHCNIRARVEGIDFMSYVSHVLQPGEKLLMTGRLHWIGYWRAFVCLALALGLVMTPAMRTALEIGAVALGVAGVGFALHVALLRWGTEIGVTDRRVIYKHGVIARYSAEMNMDKVETVAVTQSLLGRVLNYGAITIKGSGASIETLRNIADPVALRSAITAR